eukprot:1769688-Pleurochrysis_carterae.AAC.1
MPAPRTYEGSLTTSCARGRADRRFRSPMAGAWVGSEGERDWQERCGAPAHVQVDGLGKVVAEEGGAHAYRGRKA